MASKAFHPSSVWNKSKISMVKHLLKLFHMLPDGLKLYLRSFKTQEPELYELAWLVKKGSIAVDVGANKGAYTYALSRIVGTNGMVLSIEPIQELAAYLKRACRQLALPARVEQCCLSDEEGTGNLFIPLQGNELQTGYASLNKLIQGPGEVRHVEKKKLDDMLRERKCRVSFIKCDVEGHELEVFRGACDILKEDRPNLLVEIEQHHFEEPIESRFDFFQKQGYIAYYLDWANGDKELKKVAWGRSLSSTPKEKNEAMDRFGSVYNFIFLPKESAESIKRLLK
jgi:FkbM family methyltransferase